MTSLPPTEGKEKGRDGKVWMVDQEGKRGRCASQNVLTEAEGPTVHSKGKFQDPLTAFHCLVDQSILVHIQDHGEAQGVLGDDS